MKKYTILLADLDNTLLDFSASESEAVGRLFTYFGTEPTKELKKAYSAYNDALWKRLERKEITRRQLIDTRFEGFFKERNIKGDGALAAELYEKYLSESAIFIDGAKELISRCRGKIGFYIISNGTARVQLPRLAASGLDKAADGYFISELVGVNKPDKLYFDRVTANIPGFSVDNALILGDSLTADIEGGKRYGVDTCFFDRKGNTPTGGIKPDYTINKLDEIYSILNI